MKKQINFQQNISRASGEMPIMKTNVGVMNPYPHGIFVGFIIIENYLKGINLERRYRKW